MGILPLLTITYCIIKPVSPLTISRPFSSSLHSSKSSTAEAVGELTPKKIKSLDLLTFDLDNTLFPLTPVLKDANDVMVQSLASFGYPGATTESITRFTKKIRSELPLDKTSISYSELRMKAIRMEMLHLSSSSTKETMAINGNEKPMDEIVTHVFNEWLSERNKSANRNLFPDAVKMLGNLRDLFPDAKIGAVTNGRGNPNSMPLISSYFDFCVSGEDDGVFPHRKPHPGIYHAALDRASLKREELCWVHVGDDLANDVGASAACGALGVWMDFDETTEYGVGSADRSLTSDEPIWSTASIEERERRKILAEEAQSSISAQIVTLSELPEVIRKLLTCEV